MRSRRTAVLVLRHRRGLPRLTARGQRRAEDERGLKDHQDHRVRGEALSKRLHYRTAIVPQFTTRASPYAVCKVTWRPVPRDRRIIPVYLASRLLTRVVAALLQEVCSARDAGRGTPSVASGFRRNFS